MITTRPATLDDARYVGERLRAGDLAECVMFGVDPVRAIEVSMGASVIGECLLIDGEPAAVFGLQVTDFIGGVAYPWILTTDAIETNRIGYARFMRRQLERAFDMVTMLENVVDARYTRAIKLLEWLGFTLELEADGLRQFWMEKN